MNKWLTLLCCAMLAAAPTALAQTQGKKAEDKKQAALAKKKKQDEEIQAHMALVTECDKQAKTLTGSAHKNFMRKCLNQ